MWIDFKAEKPPIGNCKENLWEKCPEDIPYSNL